MATTLSGRQKAQTKMTEIVELYKPRKRPKLARRGTKRRKKGKSLSSYKKELDSVFSKYVRAKYQKTCYTCEFTGVLQNGHFVPRQYLAVRWEEDNCRPQCMNCNVFRHGKPLDFEERLVQELGAARVQELKDARKQLVRLNADFYRRKIAEYQQLLKDLCTPAS